jgi:BirA family biotin operon repressor/biotin-[acetyl-CoA-carboxylase] ligase
MAAAVEGAAGGMLFVAEEQTSGKGRKGRAWLSSPGASLTFSLLLRPVPRTEGLTGLFALAVVTALDGLVEGLAVKWPNDIFRDGRKLGGILAEARDDSVVIGLGLDVNETAEDFPPAIAAEAISLAVAGDRPFDRGIVLCRILETFEDLYDRFLDAGLAPFRAELERRLLYIGAPVIVESGGETIEGTMLGITDEGRVRLETGGAELALSSGDLTLRGGSRDTDSRA